MANSITVIGRLGKDPELGSTPSGTVAVKFSVADDRPKKNGEPVTQWFNCVAYDKMAEIINQHFSSGKPIIVTGKLNSRLYKKNNGDTGLSLDLQVTGFDFVPFLNGQQGDGAGRSKFDDPSAPEPPAPRQKPAAKGDDWDTPDIEDPFADQ